MEQIDHVDIGIENVFNQRVLNPHAPKPIQATQGTNEQRWQIAEFNRMIASNSLLKPQANIWFDEQLTSR